MAPSLPLQPCYSRPGVAPRGFRPRPRPYSVGVPEDLFDVSGSEEAPAIVLRVVAHPGAGRTSVVGIHGDALKVRVGAPPVGGRANAALVDLVAELFGVARDKVAVTSGESSRVKRVRVEGVDAAAAHRLLDQAVAHAGAGAPGRRRGGPAPVQRRV